MSGEAQERCCRAAAAARREDNTAMRSLKAASVRSGASSGSLEPCRAGETRVGRRLEPFDGASMLCRCWSG
jgi:hypothetical protein